MNNCDYLHFKNIGYLASRLSDAEMLPIRNEIEKIKSDFSAATKIWSRPL